jgi:acetyl/propionyl-CoA carboxylase alpha subunit
MHGMEDVTSDTISELELAAETRVRNSDALLRHKPVRGEYFSLHAPLIIAPQTRRWKMAGFRRATNTRMVSGSFQKRLFLSRHTGGKWLRAEGQQAVHPYCTARTVRVPVALDP